MKNKYVYLLLILFLLQIVSALLLSASADEFGTTQQTVIAQKGVQIQITMTAGESIAAKLQGLLQSNPPINSPAYKLKQYFNHTVPVGKEVTINMMIATTAIDNAK